MSGDYSRDSFDALRDYAGVFLQQGRVALDADWNEMVRILERRIRAGTVDTIGRAVVPRETPLGFEIQPGAGPALRIGRGRLYLDGMLLECHGAANFPGSGDTDFPAPVFDRARAGADGPEGVLDEPIPPAAGDFLTYDRQPYWPSPDPLPGGAGPHLVYLVAWHREVTPLEVPDLLEPALGGIDSATRWQTVWQVRVLADVGDGATCATPDSGLDGWSDEIAPSTARLTTDTIDIKDPEDPCLVPPTDGYTGLENQLYRVELHSVGAAQGDARFKFSRENASVAAAITGFATTADRVTVQSIGRDQVLRFRAGDWVEITDDRRELDHRSGQILRVALVHEETREIELEGTVDPDLVPSGAEGDTSADRRSRLIRWDQRGVVRRADGSEWVNLDDPASDGLIPVPADGTALVLESGITVSFSTAPGPGGFREMDHWRFAARTAGTQIEELVAAPPDGVQRHYTRLAVVTFPDGRDDCRTFWPPEFEGTVAESCGCTVCVTPESHESGALTIQAAVDQVGPAGGTVCLEGGLYSLDAPVTISGRVALTLRGQGGATVLAYAGAGAAIRVSGSVDVQIERLSVLARSAGDTGGGEPTVHGVSATHTAFLALRRLAVLVFQGGEAQADHGIAIDGAAVGGKIEECLVVAPVALGAPAARDDQDDRPGFLALAEIRVIDNILFGARAAVRFDIPALNVAGAIFARNMVLGIGVGMEMRWFEPPTGSTEISGSTVYANADAIRLGVGDLRLTDNEISGGEQQGDGVRLIPGSIAKSESDAQLTGNRITDLSGAGVRVETTLGALIAKRNVIRRCGTAGILAGPGATIRHAAIDNNVIEEIAVASGRDAAAIALVRTESGQIAGNRITGVAGAGPRDGLYAGIAVQGVGALSINGNAINAIGPDSIGAPAIGILGLGPYMDLSLRGNHVGGLSENEEGSESHGWIGIAVVRLGATLEDPIVNQLAGLPGIDPTGLVFAEVGLANAPPTFHALDVTGLDDLGPARERGITVSANMIGHQGFGPVHLALLLDPFEEGRRLPCRTLFSENQCRQSGFAGEGPALVQIGAESVIASGNFVTHAARTDSLNIQARVVDDRSLAAVLGNITSGRIVVGPGTLRPEFDPLNLKSP